MKFEIKNIKERLDEKENQYTESSLNLVGVQAQVGYFQDQIKNYLSQIKTLKDTLRTFTRNKSNSKYKFDETYEGVL